MDTFSSPAIGNRSFQSGVLPFSLDGQCRTRHGTLPPLYPLPLDVICRGNSNGRLCRGQMTRFGQSRISPPSFHRFPIAVPISPPFPTRSFLPRGLDSRYFGIVDQITNCYVKFGSIDEVWQVLSGKCSAQAYNIIPSNHHESSSIREGESGDSPGLGGLDALQSHQLEGAREGPVLAPQDLLNPNMRKLSRCFEAQNAANRDTFHQLEAE